MLEALSDGGGHVSDGSVLLDVERRLPLFDEFRNNSLVSLFLDPLHTVDLPQLVVNQIAHFYRLSLQMLLFFPSQVIVVFLIGAVRYCHFDFSDCFQPPVLLVEESIGGPAILVIPLLTLLLGGPRPILRLALPTFCLQVGRHFGNQLVLLSP